MTFYRSDKLNLKPSIIPLIIVMIFFNESFSAKINNNIFLIKSLYYYRYYMGIT